MLDATSMEVETRRAGGHTHTHLDLPKLIFTNSDVECTSRANDNTSKMMLSLMRISESSVLTHTHKQLSTWIGMQEVKPMDKMCAPHTRHRSGWPALTHKISLSFLVEQKTSNVSGMG